MPQTLSRKDGGYADVIDFVRGTDLLIHDAQYLNSEYFSKRAPDRGWGHSTVDRSAEAAKKAKVKRLVLFHHDPIREDREVLLIERKSQRLFPASVAAYEGIGIKPHWRRLVNSFADTIRQISFLLDFPAGIWCELSVRLKNRNLPVRPVVTAPVSSGFLLRSS
jgi:hypothetical protein